MLIPLAVTAKNEESVIAACLDSLLAAVGYAEDRLRIGFDVVVVLDDCSDRTAEIAEGFERVRTIVSSGGIVEAQRTMSGASPWIVYYDADIAVDATTLHDVARAMLDEPLVQVAYPKKVPVQSGRKSLLAQALFTYNRFNGFQTPRRYFNGRFFAIRNWHVPSIRDLENRLASLPRDRFYDYHAGVRVDDIYLSRDILARYGPGAIRETEGGLVYYRPPATFAGMYRTYRRMRMEIERLNVIFPETAGVHARYGRRGYDRDAVRRAGLRERWLWRYFRLALGVCQTLYRMERFYYRHLSSRTCIPWQPIEESKLPMSCDTIPPV